MDKEIAKYIVDIQFTIDGQNRYGDTISKGYLNSKISVRANGLGELGSLLQRIQEAINDKADG